MTEFLHALSIDVEDYFQVLNLRGHVEREDWETLELRCGEATERFLELLDRHQATATFFFLGWIAERLPELVRRVAERGHEIGSHGYDHKVLPELGEDGFREDLRKTSRILREVCGVEPKSFRACTWSIGKKTPWAFRVLRDEGFELDSSVQPVTHPDYGVPGAPRRPYRVEVGDRTILEFPPMTWRVLGRSVPVGGGGFLRLLPTWFFVRGLRQAEADGWPGCIYLHPWELDPEQPRYEVGGLRGFRHYVNLRKTGRKLEKLLGQFRFVGLSEALAQSSSRRAKWAAFKDSELLG
ncbi:MAG: XrtA system polysaccharide deacetylase [Planctomycetota bacterium]